MGGKETLLRIMSDRDRMGGQVNQNEHDRIKRAKLCLHVYPLSRCMQSVQRLAAFAALPALIASCTTASPERAHHEIYITARTLERVYTRDEQIEIIGTFELVNRSDLLICFNEDILVNQLSPYIRLSYNDDEHGRGIPHPPETSDIAQLHPDQHREFRRVVGYTTSPSADRHRYTISIQLWECNTSRPFLRHATLVG